MSRKKTREEFIAEEYYDEGLITEKTYNRLISFKIRT